MNAWQSFQPNKAKACDTVDYQIFTKNPEDLWIKTEFCFLTPLLFIIWDFQIDAAFLVLNSWHQLEKGGKGRSVDCKRSIIGQPIAPKIRIRQDYFSEFSTSLWFVKDQNVLSLEKLTSTGKGREGGRGHFCHSFLLIVQGQS